jgi:deazaflavin-dependent oxidoreductase (nitroreductase family)
MPAAGDRSGVRLTKRRLSRFFSVRILNPVARPLAARGLLGSGVSVLETTGRKSGQQRRTPVGNGLRGDTFWIVAEHGFGAAYVKNIEANPRVRVKVGRRPWRAGTARILADDDPYERMRMLKRPGNDAAVRLNATQLLVIRVDLDRS